MHLEEKGQGFWGDICSIRGKCGRTKGTGNKDRGINICCPELWPNVRYTNSVLNKLSRRTINGSVCFVSLCAYVHARHLWGFCGRIGVTILKSK